MTMAEEENDDPQIFNEGIISEWHNLTTDYGSLKKLARVGDRLELQREGYCHWAIFVGDQFVELEDQVLIVPCIIHRANPTDNPNNFGGGISSSSRSIRKGVYGIGDVCLEPLRDVWGISRLRINNSLDNSSPPFPSATVVERVMGVLNGEGRQALTAYNVVTNNCEHFVSWARNGWALSHQVKNITEKCLSVCIVAVGVLLPRPLAVMGGICLTGVQVARELRRS